MSNVVNLRAYRTLSECEKLFNGYEAKCKLMHKSELLAELERYQKERSRYPNHLLTITKGKILMAVLSSRARTPDLKNYAESEMKRIHAELTKRLYE